MQLLESNECTDSFELPLRQVSGQEQGSTVEICCLGRLCKAGNPTKSYCLTTQMCCRLLFIYIYIKRLELILGSFPSRQQGLRGPTPAKSKSSTPTNLSKDYECQTPGFGVIDPDALGTTEEECCAQRKCEERPGTGRERAGSRH